MSMRWGIALALGIAGATLGPVPTAEALRVLVFNSSRFVDSGQTYLPPGSQESDNLQAALQALGHTVTTIAGPFDSVGDCPGLPAQGPKQPGTLLATAAEYAAALANADVFLVPEHESWCNLPGELADNPSIGPVWRSWVEQGGAMVIHSSEEARPKVTSFLEVVFGLSGVAGVNGTGVQTAKTAAAALTQFAGGPAVLPGNASTGLLSLDTLPAGSLSIYDNGAAASVAIIPVGSGKIVFLGWDWTQSDPPFHGDGVPPFDDDGQNGGWYPVVLDAAVKESVTTPLTIVVSGGGTVTSDPAGLSCAASCTANVPKGTVLTLSATPAAGALFGGWTGGSCGGLGACVVTVGGATTLTATFTPVTGLALALALDRPAIPPGDTVRIDIAVANPGPAQPVDLYLGLLVPAELGGSFGCPALDPVAFVADNFARVVPACLSAAPATFPPLIGAVSIPGGLPATVVPGFWRPAIPADAPPGTYTVFLVATLPGAFAGGAIGPGDILALGLGSFTLVP
jgi:hypothetical protein